jgi:hypothetical protein
MDGSSGVRHEAMACIGYISGFADGVEIGRVVAAYKIYGEKALDWTVDEGARRLGSYCKPGPVTVGQAIRIVVNYLEAHPEQLHESPRTLVNGALADAFPCK